jgi:hypothetical protein
MQARILKLLTCTQQTLALIGTARCAVHASLECVCERALKNNHELKNVIDFFCLAFLSQQISDKMMHCKGNY